MYYIHRYQIYKGHEKIVRYSNYWNALKAFKRIQHIIDFEEEMTGDYTMTNLLIEKGVRYGNNKEGAKK